MSTGKRAFDLLLALAGVALLWPLLLLVALAVRLCDGPPILYRAERMRAPDQPFTLWKFRTMRPDPTDRGVSGGDKARRITRLGGHLRRLRLDELPQLWNLLNGDISVVGPRPPLRRYVEAHPRLYAAVLRSRPGLTGMATVHFRHREETLLAPCRSAEETERTYSTRCIPAKARLDLLYARRRTLWLDLHLILMTFLPDRRRRR
ncbi:sugar transferase [Oceanicola sp. S124]|uniref:sugar transferase n=1 Tax=Oceanicola sp. S124 TaxID=1042378 RepID=UPI0003174C30|nr:sugar transferase [Oceanicola sp. S124]